MSTRKNITHKLFNFFQSKNIPDDVELLNSIIAGLEDETLTYLEVLTAIDGKEKQSFVDPRLSELYYLYSNGYEIPDLISIIKNKMFNCVNTVTTLCRHSIRCWSNFDSYKKKAIMGRRK